MPPRCFPGLVGLRDSGRGDPAGSVLCPCLWNIDYSKDSSRRSLGCVGITHRFRSEPCLLSACRVKSRLTKGSLPRGWACRRATDAAGRFSGRRVACGGLVRGAAACLRLARRHLGFLVQSLSPVPPFATRASSPVPVPELLASPPHQGRTTTDPPAGCRRRREPRRVAGGCRVGAVGHRRGFLVKHPRGLLRRDLSAPGLLDLYGLLADGIEGSSRVGSCLEGGCMPGSRGGRSGPGGPGALRGVDAAAAVSDTRGWSLRRGREPSLRRGIVDGGRRDGVKGSEPPGLEWFEGSTRSRACQETTARRGRSLWSSERAGGDARRSPGRLFSAVTEAFLEGRRCSSAYGVGAPRDGAGGEEV